MIDLPKELGGRRNTPAIYALDVCAFPLSAALRLFIFLCPQLSLQPRCLCDLLLSGFPKGCWYLPCLQHHSCPPCAPAHKHVIGF